MSALPSGNLGTLHLANSATAGDTIITTNAFGQTSFAGANTYSGGTTISAGTW